MGTTVMFEPREGYPPTEVAREEEFLRLLMSHERRIHAFLMALVPQWSDADDLLQETATVLWRKFDQFEAGTDFAAWALSIARFQVMNFRKKQRRVPNSFGDEVFEAIADRMMAVAQQSDARRDALEQCLKHLKEQDRELVRLRYQPEATTQSVADQVSRSLRAVYKALNRIHDQLLTCVRQKLAAEAAR